VCLRQEGSDPQCSLFFLTETDARLWRAVAEESKIFVGRFVTHQMQFIVATLSGCQVLEKKRKADSTGNCGR
jgi:hypothetical protein